MAVILCGKEYTGIKAIAEGLHSVYLFSLQSAALQFHWMATHRHLCTWCERVHNIVEVLSTPLSIVASYLCPKGKKAISAPVYPQEIQSIQPLKSGNFTFTSPLAALSVVSGGAAKGE